MLQLGVPEQIGTLEHSRSSFDRRSAERNDPVARFVLAPPHVREPLNEIHVASAQVHALCLAALRHNGFRPSKRYIVFQVLPDTLGLGPEVWRVLSKCHDMRNRTEYEGVLDVDDRLVSDLIGACRKVAGKVSSLPPIPKQSK